MAAKSKEALVSADPALAVQASVAETSAQKSAKKKASAAKTSSAKTSSAKTSSAKASSAKASSAKTSSAKTSSAKTSSAKTSSAKTSSGVSSAKKATQKEATRATVAQKEQARKARAGARIAGESSKAIDQAVKTPFNASQAQAALATAEPSPLVSDQGGPAVASGRGSFLAANYTTGDIWVPNAAIPTIDEATYHAQKSQAEGQRRALEVASLNLQNINSLHQLERQHVAVAISAKTTETRAAELTGAEIDYQRQVVQNGEKSEHLMQASAKREAATRETGYTQQLIALKDQNFELEIQQAQTVFAEKAARYRAQLTGQ